MNTPYEKLPFEQRQEWTEHPVTRAFFATVGLYRGQVVEQLIGCARDNGGAGPTAGYGGVIRALDFMADLARKGSRE